MYKKSKKGQSLVEYGLILALVTVIGIAVVQSLGGQITNTLDTVRDSFTNANSAAQTSAGIT